MRSQSKCASISTPLFYFMIVFHLKFAYRYHFSGEKKQLVNTSFACLAIKQYLKWVGGFWHPLFHIFYLNVDIFFDVILHCVQVWKSKCGFCWDTLYNEHLDKHLDEYLDDYLYVHVGSHTSRFIFRLIFG